MNRRRSVVMAPFGACDASCSILNPMIRLVVEEDEIELAACQGCGADHDCWSARGRGLYGRRAGERRDDALAASRRPRSAAERRSVHDVIRSLGLERGGRRTAGRQNGLNVGVSTE